MSAPAPRPTRHLSAFCASHPGEARQDNEDAFGLFIDQGLFVVADGMGGRSSGDVAAQLAVDEVERFFRTKLQAPREPWPFPIDKQMSLGANLLRVGLQVANAHIRKVAAALPDHHRMGATVAALAIGETHYAAANLGDVRVYQFRDGALARLSRDHSLVEEIRAARPEATEEELSRMASRNLVTRALGIKDEVEPTLYQGTLQAGDIYLLACDGLWNEVDESAIATILAAGASSPAELEATCQRLIDAANAAGGRDNITALVVQVD